MSFQLAENVRWIRDDGGAVIFVPLSRRFVDLDDAGAMLFEMLERTEWSAVELADAIRSLGATVESEAREIADSFLLELVRLGVLSEGSDPGASEHYATDGTRNNDRERP